MKRAFIPIFVAALVWSGPLLAQGTNIAFGAAAHDTTQPVEVTADSLSVNQQDGRAVFVGNVLVAQGDIRLNAGRIEVEYASGSGTAATGIRRLIASEGVTLVSATEAAEGREAVYDVEAGTIVLSGDVVLVQGPNTLSGEKLTVDLNTGAGTMEGRVRTIFQTGGN